ncbi:type IA DNA topoisomerase [Blautia sp. MSK17_66]|uniref:DNA topoisomerase n=1 Tax=Blautia TaxID=572511 RepID=UPI00156E7AB8|nr:MULTISPECIES: DNA topoisomerase [Blautia]MCB5548821.1 type IA DNA topoisomerase [Blautia sp. MSK17_66]NSK00483.1 type IA DNA topoisomerase [Blautia obeum]
MSKALYIAEKPSVAQEFAKALKINGQRKDGYLESEDSIVTWCVGHLVTMSYPEKYDIKYKRWSFDTLPFLPREFKYEVIPGVQKQFDIVKRLLNRPDVETIYVCTDSGREGEYIYRLVAQMAGVKDKDQRRVWIDSQTEEEILRGIREARELSAYDNLANSAYLRAKEDYLMGINFSRVLTLRYGNSVSNYLNTKYQAIAVGRVMTCVLGMVVRREREIRCFVKTPFYRVISGIALEGEKFDGEWRAMEGSRYFKSPYLYKENGFKERKHAQELIDFLNKEQPLKCCVEKIERKRENKNPPLLFNLAELQNVCSKLFKISPDETLKIVQELYEKKLVTYPRTDARVLSTAVSKEIYKNIAGLRSYSAIGNAAEEILQMGSYKSIAKTRYVNDKQITDHYAIIPTGQGLNVLGRLSLTSQRVYETIVRRFLCIFCPPAVYQKVSLVTEMQKEKFFSSFKVLQEEGYLKYAVNSFVRRNTGGTQDTEKSDSEDVSCDAQLLAALHKLKKGDILDVDSLEIKEGETSPPKRYNSGSMILAMENAGQLIEDEELRAQIKGSGIGTSATRAEILKKLFSIKYLSLNKKTQVITPTLLGEMIFDVVNCSIRQLLNPELTASWEKGLNYVAEGSITPQEYMDKLEHFVRIRTDQVEQSNYQYALRQFFDAAAVNYQKKQTTSKRGGNT